MQILLYSVHVEEGIDPDVVHTPVVPSLMQTLSVKVAEVDSCDPEVGLNALFHLIALFSSEGALGLVLIKEIL